MPCPLHQTQHFGNGFAAYTLVLKKPGCLDIFYDGTATNKIEGAKRRRRKYDNFAVDAMASPKGYKITSKVLLAYTTRLPTPKKKSRRSVLFYALEAASSLTFWTMKSRTFEYGMIDMTFPRSFAVHPVLFSVLEDLGKRQLT